MRHLIIMAAAAVALVLATGVAFAEDGDQSGIKDNGIPVMVVNIDENAEGYGTIDEMNTSPDHSAECTGTVDIHVPEGFKTDYTDAQFGDLNNLQLNYIRGRGNSTWMTSIKKPYKVRFKAEQDLFGMGASEHWVLLANLYDKTKVKNRITYWLGRELGLEFTPHGVPVDLWFKTVDGSRNEYIGTYYLCEQIRVEPNRVNIDELKSEHTTVPEITGGYLLSRDNWDIDEEYAGYRTNRDVRFFFEEPTLKKQTAGKIAQRQYISGYLQDTEDAIFAEDYDHDAVAAKMDLLSAADYWWLQSFSFNTDAFQTSSTYLYKKREGKLYWGPLWDFDLAWGTELRDSFDVNEDEWIDQLRKVDPKFRQLMMDRWEILDVKLQELTAKGGVLDQYREELRDSWEADYAIYGDHEYDWDEEEVWDGTYDSEYEDLRDFIETRRLFVNTHLENLVSGLCRVDFVADGQLIESNSEVKFDACVEAGPKAPEKDGYVFVGWYTEDGVSSKEAKVIEDTIFYAKYVEEEKATKAQEIYFRDYDCWITVSGGEYYSVCTIWPEDAEDKRVTWTSSDESVATVDADGIVSPHGVGYTDITGTLTCGASNTYRIHVYDENDTTEYAEAKIIADTPELTMNIGERKQFRFHTDPQNEPNTYMNPIADCTIDDPEIAKVDDDRIVHGIKAGKTTLRIKISNGEEEVNVECPVTVNPYSIDNALIKLSGSSYTYNGQVIKPSVESVGGRALVEGTDYTVSYSDASAKNVGQYTVTVTGIGNYGGTAKAIYQINPKGVTSKKLRRAKRAVQVRWKRQKTKMSKVRITGYQIQIATDKNFTTVVKTVKVKGWKKSYKWVKGLKKKKRYYARVRTYMEVGGVRYYSSWGKVRTARTR